MKAKSRKGQMTIVALITVTIMLIFFSGLLPVINNAINSILDQVSGPTKLLLLLIPFCIVAMIIKELFTYGEPRY